jgi:hypothetical protein
VGESEEVPSGASVTALAHPSDLGRKTPERPSYSLLLGAVSASEVRTWALENGIQVSPTGGLPRFAYLLFMRARESRGSRPE